MACACVPSVHRADLLRGDRAEAPRSGHRPAVRLLGGQLRRRSSCDAPADASDAAWRLRSLQPVFLLQDAASEQSRFPLLHLQPAHPHLGQNSAAARQLRRPDLRRRRAVAHDGRRIHHGQLRPPDHRHADDRLPDDPRHCRHDVSGGLAAGADRHRADAPVHPAFLLYFLEKREALLSDVHTVRRAEFPRGGILHQLRHHQGLQS